MLQDSDKLLNTGTPVFPQCFQDTILVWMPCAIFLLTLPFYLPYLYSWPTVNTWRDKGRWQVVKLVRGYN